MKTNAVLIALLVALFATWAHAQPSPSGPAACHDAKTLDQLTKVLDDALSGPANKDRTCLRALMAPGARLTPVRKGPDGSIVVRNLTIDDWINAVSQRGSEVFYERQIKTVKQQYGHIAQIWCEYVTITRQDGPPTSHGINGFQAVYDGSHWTLVTVIWETEDSAGAPPVITP